MKILTIISLLSALPLGAVEKSSIEQSGESQAVVTVGGQVRRPGPVPYSKEMTVYGAIQTGGGPTEFGSMRRVKVIRAGKVLNFDLTKDEQKTALVLKNDTIEVPQKNLLGR